MRGLHKSWDNRQRAAKNRPYQTWNRRVRWYEGDDDVRLNFEDHEGSVNCYYKDVTAAQADYDAFREGRKGVQQLRAEHYTRGKHAGD